MAKKNIEPGTPEYALYLIEECLKNKTEEHDLGKCGFKSASQNQERISNRISLSRNMP